MNILLLIASAAYWVIVFNMLGGYLKGSEEGMQQAALVVLAFAGLLYFGLYKLVSHFRR